MKEKDLIRRLNWFYGLETTQVENYLAQSRAVKDKYISIGLERVAMIEEGHVDNIKMMIVGLGGKPSVASDVFFPVAGSAFGKVLSIPDIPGMMRANIRIEAMAVRDYQRLIDTLENEGKYDHLVQTLKYNLIDEDLHSAWFLEGIKYHESAAWPLSPQLFKEASKQN